MIHEREGLSLGFESAQGVFGADNPSNEFDGHFRASTGMTLLGGIDRAHSSLADGFDDLITVDFEGWSLTGRLQRTPTVRRRRVEVSARSS